LYDSTLDLRVIKKKKCLGKELEVGAVVHLDGIIHRRAPREIPRRKHLINPGKCLFVFYSRRELEPLGWLLKGRLQFHVGPTGVDDHLDWYDPPPRTARNAPGEST